MRRARPPTPPARAGRPLIKKAGPPAQRARGGRARGRKVFVFVCLASPPHQKEKKTVRSGRGAKRISKAGRRGPPHSQREEPRARARIAAGKGERGGGTHTQRQSGGGKKKQRKKKQTQERRRSLSISRGGGDARPSRPHPSPPPIQAQYSPFSMTAGMGCTSVPSSCSMRYRLNRSS